MKINQPYHKPSQKPIKYKQFIQELQNSSRSSNNDQSLLSQRSFRQSYSVRDHRESSKNQTNEKNCQKEEKFTQSIQKSSYKIANPLEIDSKNKLTQNNDKLYTFCDAKITQRSIQMMNVSNSKNNNEQIQYKPSAVQDNKYFKTKKQRNEQKQNINFVNQILEKVESGGFQGKVLKTQAQQTQNMQRSVKKSPQSLQFTNKQSDSKQISQSNSQRKIQSVKKIFVLSKQPTARLSNNKTLNYDASEQKSRQSSLRKKQQRSQKQKCSQQKCSSKKKIVSLNINPLKPNTNQQNNKLKIKLSLDKSYDKNVEQKSFNLQSRGSLVEAKLLSQSVQKMSSLEQSKIQSLCSKSNLLMSGASLSQLTNFFIKQPQIQPQQQLQRLHKTIEQHKQKEKKLTRQINQLTQKLRHPSYSEDKREVQILQKDCSRLTNSYKEIKKLYEMAVRDKEEVQSQMQTLMSENDDLKQCLNFKSNQAAELRNRVNQLTMQIEELQSQLQTRVFPSELSGLSQIIKQKLTQHESEISSLLDQNHKLTLLREKLQNFNETLKEEIEQKDNLIWQLERQIKQVSNLRRSCKDEIGDYRQNEYRLNKLCKQLESKLKLANMHNQYLTKQIVTLKQQKKQLIKSSNNSNNTSLLMTGNSPLQKAKLNKFNTLANTITTRNSSISHGRDHFDHFINTLNRQKEQENQIYSSEETNQQQVK